jgi:predicted dithiol-disulfide oxidoreductase (DUF899 family)
LLELFDRADNYNGVDVHLAHRTPVAVSRAPLARIDAGKSVRLDVLLHVGQ